MKKLLLITFAATFVLGAMSSCDEEEVDMGKEEIKGNTYAEEEEVFYYYGYEDRKIFLQQQMDKIFLQFAPDADQAQIRSLIHSNPSLCPISCFHLEMDLDYAILEERSGNPIGRDILGSFQSRPEVLSAAYLMGYRGGWLGLLNSFAVGLKASISNAQLQELATQHHCIVGRKYSFDFMEESYQMYVSKTCKLNALQMANLFYETGRFTFAEPNFLIFNALVSVNNF